MANPFGIVVDDLRLETIERYMGKPKTQEDRARVAMEVQNECSEEARKYVEGVKEFYGDGKSTQCMIYNATGETLYYAYDHDYFGTLCRTPYPLEIGNGQWVSFLHAHPIASLTAGSEAAVIYRGKQKDGFSREFLLAWSTPFAVWYNNKAYCELSVGDKITSSWDDIYEATNNSDYSLEIHRDGMNIEVQTAKGSSPKFIAKLYIPYSP